MTADLIDDLNFATTCQVAFAGILRIGEFTYKREDLDTFYSVGSIVAAWCTFGTFRIDGTASWRIPSALQESPRWLISKGRNEEVLAVLAKYHGEGDEDDTAMQFGYVEIQSALGAEHSAAEFTISSFLRELVTGSGNHRRLFIMVWVAISSQMFGNAFVPYYLSPILNLVGLTSDLQQALINATSQMLSWANAVYFATLPAKLGRRTLFLRSLCAMWVIDICIMAGSAIFAKDHTNKASLPTLSLSSSICSRRHILPFHLRTKVLSFFYFVQFYFMILSTFAVPIGLENLEWLFYIIFVVWVVVEFIGVFDVS
ncbi:sugar transporter, putative [Talaromyces stipitatus ATCC 10500]|uniref:Sugar transporter, putative n=1 Tax=Talaromyces stipitatus (strain ATCC 10500 / CBS 375.48 / QM 6759 / NRRL 1006) TaxID=441959 RepID=B8M9B0_TALSN|nr:sugar transporter, putative [Talaromyces stipitatus ATCC 10500]EED17670.1 sugar transporter, putative [Talaromyces stipitatus ATCC 10500]